MPKIFKSLQDVQIQQIQGKSSSVLGVGGFSQVRLVYHRDNPKVLYAMKKLFKKNQTEIAYIKQELELHQQLMHPNIIQLVDYLETKTDYYFFLEYAPYGDLFDYLRNEKPDDTQLIEIFYQTVSAIEYMHQKNIMHRDLKPENILIGRERAVKVCDFGWSAQYSESEHRETLCGTYEYMAMEIYMGKKQTLKTDIWSLGILLYEMFHGYAPFRGLKMEDVMTEIVKDDIQFKPDLNPAVRKVILRILTIDPRRRPSAKDLMSDPLFNEINSRRQTMQKEFPRPNPLRDFRREISSDLNEKFKRKIFVKSQDKKFFQYKQPSVENIKESLQMSKPSIHQQEIFKTLKKPKNQELQKKQMEKTKTNFNSNLMKKVVSKERLLSSQIKKMFKKKKPVNDKKPKKKKLKESAKKEEKKEVNCEIYRNKNFLGHKKIKQEMELDQKINKLKKSLFQKSLTKNSAKNSVLKSNCSMKNLYDKFKIFKSNSKKGIPLQLSFVSKVSSIDESQTTQRLQSAQKEKDSIQTAIYRNYNLQPKSSRKIKLSLDSDRFVSNLYQNNSQVVDMKTPSSKRSFQGEFSLKKNRMMNMNSSNTLDCL